MKKTIIIMSLLTLTFITTKLSAQSFTSFQYTVGIPFGGLKDHTSNVSGRGFTFEFHKEVAPSVSVGINLAYSVFYEQMDYGSYTQGTATLTGMQYRYNNVFPMLINAHYMFGEGMLIPYVGLGMGTVYDLRNTNMGLYSIEEKNWHFLISPEAGFLLDLSQNTSFKLNAKYDNAFKIHEADGFSNLSINIGFVKNSW
jgi:hypothetical protein